jgi:LysM repeat protein
VQTGDTLRGIAEQFNVSVQALIDANNLTPQQADALRIGQELVIP